jgi:hypothetical protein
MAAVFSMRFSYITAGDDEALKSARETSLMAADIKRV